MALRHNPKERYITVELFSADLRRYLAMEPVLACSQSPRYRLHKFVRAHRVGVAASVALAVALLAGITGTTLQMLEARRQSVASAIQVRRAESVAEFASALLQPRSCPQKDC